MTEILISLMPKWCKKILRGEKIIELRKSKPQCECPVRLFLYETKKGRGAVVGECLCYCIAEIDHPEIVTDGSCLTTQQIKDYAKGKKAYAWYVGKVITYERPVPISDFGITRAPQSWCYIRRAA